MENAERTTRPRFRAAPWLTAFCMLHSAFCLPARAGVEVDVPALRGFYRPGRYLPLHIKAAFDDPPKGSRIVIRADGAVAVSLDLVAGRADAIVPFLVLDRPQNLRWEWWKVSGKRQELLRRGALPDPDLRPLPDERRLVGFTSVDLAFAQSLFPGSEIQPIALDESRPISGTPVAWEMLDAVVLDAPAAGRLSQAALATLLAGGAVVAVKSDRPPERGWPWARQGDYYVLRCPLAGPTQFGWSQNIDVIYQPAQGWKAGWPSAVRWRIVLYAVLFSIVALGLCLLPRHWAAGAMVLISGGAVALLWVWAGFQTPVLQRSGEVMVLASGLVQADSWTYQTSANAWPAEMPFFGLTRPIFASPQQMRQLSMTLFCQAGGEPAIFVHGISPNLRVAFLSRRVGPQPPAAAPDPGQRSPLEALVKQLYLRPGDRILGALPATPTPRPAYGQTELWPAVVISRP